MKKGPFFRIAITASFLLILPVWGDEVVVLPKGAVNLRLEPMPSSKVIRQLTQGSKVKLIERSVNSFEFDKLTDNWCKVEDVSGQGWVFCAYIGLYYRNFGNDSGPLAYLPAKKEIISVQKINKGPQGMNRSVGSETRIITKYRNGVIYTDITEYEGGGYEIFFPNANLYEGFLMIWGGFREWSELSDVKDGIKIPHGVNGATSVRRKGKGILISYSWAA